MFSFTTIAHSVFYYFWNVMNIFMPHIHYIIRLYKQYKSKFIKEQYVILKKIILINKKLGYMRTLDDFDSCDIYCHNDDFMIVVDYEVKSTEYLNGRYMILICDISSDNITKVRDYITNFERYQKLILKNKSDSYLECTLTCMKIKEDVTDFYNKVLGADKNYHRFLIEQTITLRDTLHAFTHLYNKDFVYTNSVSLEVINMNTEVLHYHLDDTL